MMLNPIKQHAAFDLLYIYLSVQKSVACKNINLYKGQIRLKYMQ